MKTIMMILLPFLFVFTAEARMANIDHEMIYITPTEFADMGGNCFLLVYKITYTSVSAYSAVVSEQKVLEHCHEEGEEITTKK